MCCNAQVIFATLRTLTRIAMLDYHRYRPAMVLNYYSVQLNVMLPAVCLVSCVGVPRGRLDDVW